METHVIWDAIAMTKITTCIYVPNRHLNGQYVERIYFIYLSLYIWINSARWSEATVLPKYSLYWNIFKQK